MTLSSASQHCYRLYTGPVAVRQVAAKLRTVDFIQVQFEGCEHVYLLAPSAEDVLSAIDSHMSGFTSRDVREVRNVW